MHARKVSPSLIQLLVTLIYPQTARPSPLATGATTDITPHADTINRTRNSRSTASATVINSCNFPVYLWSVADASGPCQTLSPNGGTFTEAYQQRTSGGISLKIALDQTLSGSISQLEYTVVPDGAYVGIFWDLSHVNGQPFLEYGEQVVPTVTGGPTDGTCQVISCTPGQVCEDAYNQSDDDQATHECPLDTDLVHTLCSGGNGTTTEPEPVTISAAMESSSPSIGLPGTPVTTSAAMESSSPSIGIPGTPVTTSAAMESSSPSIGLPGTPVSYASTMTITVSSDAPGPATPWTTGSGLVEE